MNRNDIFFVTTFCVFIFSCHHEKKSKDKFSVPKIIQTMKFDSIEKYNSNFLNANQSDFIGKFMFHDNIILEYETHDGYKFIKHDTAFYHDFIRENDKRYYHNSDSLLYDGLQIVLSNNTIDYKYRYQNDTNSIVGTEFYPCFIVNETQNSKLLKGKDGFVFGIQLAQDSNGMWFPIEIPIMDFCGNGGFKLVIHSKEFALIRLQKYTGNFKTKIKFLLINGDCQYSSNEIDGFINYSQFYFNRKEYDYERYKKYNEKSIYGYTLKDFEDRNK